MATDSDDETFNYSFPICPWCNHEHYDSWESCDSGVFDCEKCERQFHCERDVTVSYTCKKVTDDDN